MIAALSTDIFDAVRTSLTVAAGATLFASLIGIPLGISVGISEFPLKRVVVTAIDSLMAVPTVVVGLFVYAFISRGGPLGGWGLLFTPAAIVIGGSLLAAPIVAHYALGAARAADPRILPTALTLGAGRMRAAFTLASEIRRGIVAAVVAGFARVVSEVGVAMMLGGNIRGYTRTMTTAIALETGKGEFAFGMTLGLILLAVAFAVNVGFSLLQRR